LAEAAVVNSSPLIALAAIGHFDILRLAARSVVVTEAVKTEVTDDRSRQAMASCTWLRQVPNPPIPPRIAGFDLGAGEKTVLAWAVAHPGADVVLDDRAARRFALDLGLRVRGTLGLVLLAKRHAVIPAARPVVEQLRATGLYLSDKLMSQALALVGE